MVILCPVSGYDHGLLHTYMYQQQYLITLVLAVYVRWPILHQSSLGPNLLQSQSYRFAYLAMNILLYPCFNWSMQW